MIIARAPLRISFLGGGTDNEDFINQFEFGIVLGTAINRYVYVFVEDQPSFEKSKFKFAYRTVEEVERPQDFAHPVVKSMLTDLGITRPLNIATMANLPGRSGLGSSSAFTVSLYAAISKLLGNEPNPLEIAKYAIYCERILMKEAGGYQDQFHSSFGGFRSYKFEKDQVEVSKFTVDENKIRYLEKCMILIATIASRPSKLYAEVWNKKLANSKDLDYVLEMRDLCETTIDKITRTESKEDVYEILAKATKRGWEQKKLYMSEIDPEVNQIINHGYANGADAAKLCGAGGSGFVLLLAKPENIQGLKNAFPASQVVMPLFENNGVIVNEF